MDPGRSAVLGALVWLAGAPFVQADQPELAWVHRFVLLAVLVGVPLAYRALRLGDAPLDRATLVLQPVAGVLALGGGVLAPGRMALALALPWLAFALLRAVAGMLRLATTPRLDVKDGALALADLMLPVGSFWLVVAHGGGAFMGIRPPLPILTAVHFHYTTYTALVLLALAARAAGESRDLQAATLLAAVGTPITAAGITLVEYGDAAGARIALGGAVMVVAAFVLLALRTLGLAMARPALGPARWLLGASSVLGLAGVPLGLVWAYDQAYGAFGVDLAFMVRFHGAVNAAGFVLPALLAWSIVRPAHHRGALRVRFARGPLTARPASASRPIDAPPAAREHRWDQVLAAPDAPAEVQARVFERARAALLRFDVGEQGLAQAAPTPLAPGRDIGQTARVGLLDFEAGLRVKDLEEAPGRVVLTVQTLEGHPEAGTKTYELVHDAGVVLSMRSTSGPGAWWLRLLRKRVRRLQDRVNRSVLEGFRQRVA